MNNCPVCGKNLKDRKYRCECGFKIKNSKFEQIEKRAWELLIAQNNVMTCMLDDENNRSCNTEIIQGCWKVAEEFYNYVKEKEEKI